MKKKPISVPYTITIIILCLQLTIFEYLIKLNEKKTDN